MAEADRVELAHEPDFILGGVTVSPSRRTVLRDGHAPEILEHRVMQVLITLAKAKGAIVTRTELTQSCWEGRVVGEDAINRVISRLRKAAETIGAGIFKVETVTKIGYRLVTLEADGRAAPVSGAAATPKPPVRVTRRAVIAAAVAAGGVGFLAGGTLLYRRLAAPVLPPEVATLTMQGRIAMSQSDREGANQAVGLFRRVTEIAPDHADGWGLLGVAYGRVAYFRPQGEYQAMRERAVAVAGRALQLDPANSYGLLAQAVALPSMGHWLEFDRLIRRALAGRPGDPFILAIMGSFLSSVGRFNEALACFDRLPKNPPIPSQYYQHILALWGAGRVEQLDRLMSEAATLYPTQFSNWFARFYIHLHGGQPGAAIAQAEDIENRPSGIDQEEIESILAVARAALSRDSRAIGKVMTDQMERAHQGSGMAENALQFACLFGRLDEAFEIANAYYFNRGFIVPDVRFKGSQGSYSSLDSRYTRLLFEPSTRAMRADPRFKPMTTELGMERYWQEVGVQPDYRRH